MPLFCVAAHEWLASRTTLAPTTIATYEHFVSKLIAEFGRRLICDIAEQEIADLQRKRLDEGRSPRTVNFEVNTLRQILKKHRLWGAIADRILHLRERKDIERAITSEDERRLLDAIKRSRSPALLPLFVLSVDSGVRASEVRALRRADLGLKWKDHVIDSGPRSRPGTKIGYNRGRPMRRKFVSS